uniref:HlyD family type I secretion periplasmic adaptor subunit n=1 Tax=Enterobacter asburiae TaxID=61645 RepID=UPI0015960B63|nr:HlyD family type I secretion periplasmic adaptor subunit [Enterobacter asburiae]
MLLLVFFISVLFLNVNVTVHARGYLEVKNKNIVIEHANGGRINNLYVREGDRVKKGQLLAVIDNSYVSEDYEKNRTNLESLRMKELRLLAQINKVDFVSSLDGQSTLFEQEYAEYISQMELLKKSLDIAQSAEKQKTSMLGQLRTQENGLLKEKEIAIKQVDIVKSLVSSGAVSSSNYLSAKNDYQKIENMLLNVVAQQETLKVEIEQAKLNVAKVSTDFISKSQQELLRIQDQINEAQAKQGAVSRRQEQAKILSSVDGTVQNMAKANAGAVISPGGEILTILPDNVPVVVIVKVKPEERDKLWQGMSSRINVNTLGGVGNIPLNGVISVISSDSIEERDGRYYKVEISVNNISETTQVYPGMSADVYLTVGKRSIFQYIFKPLRNGLSTALNEL